MDHIEIAVSMCHRQVRTRLCVNLRVIREAAIIFTTEMGEGSKI
jgi:hypothetical protein